MKINPVVMAASVIHFTCPGCGGPVLFFRINGNAFCHAHGWLRPDQIPPGIRALQDKPREFFRAGYGVTLRSLAGFDVKFPNIPPQVRGRS